MHRYIELNFQDKKIEAAKLAVESLIEFKNSLAEIESHSHTTESIDPAEKKKLEDLRKNLYDRFVSKDGKVLYASFAI
jgi:hypothetical protein